LGGGGDNGQKIGPRKKQRKEGSFWGVQKNIEVGEATGGACNRKWVKMKGSYLKIVWCTKYERDQQKHLYQRKAAIAGDQLSQGENGGEN